MALHLYKLESSSPRDTLCQVWLKLAQWFWRRRWKCEKFTDRRTDGRTYGRTDRQTDDGRQVIRKAHLSFQLRWAKNQRNYDGHWDITPQGCATVLLPSHYTRGYKNNRYHVDWNHAQINSVTKLNKFEYVQRISSIKSNHHFIDYDIISTLRSSVTNYRNQQYEKLDISPLSEVW